PCGYANAIEQTIAQVDR
ncbi:hypothetical protein, partial [Kingella kingae]